MRPNTTRPLAIALVAAMAAASTLAPALATAASPTPRASLTDIESDVMCVVCKTPLAVSQSPEADRERALITTDIAKGETKAQIESDLVQNYGPAVLGLPPAHGFNLTVYVLPPAVVLLGLAGLAFALPRWRRRAKATAIPDAAPQLATADSKRLDEDLARFGR